MMLSPHSAATLVISACAQLACHGLEPSDRASHADGGAGADATADSTDRASEGWNYSDLSEVKQCPGSRLDPSDSFCRSNADCSEAERCALSNPAPCGIQFPPTIECNVDDDCDEGFICLVSADANSCTSGPNQKCESACTETSCGAGQQCGEDGRCAAVQCGQQYQCPDGLVCDPERTFANANGCVEKRCETDASCAANSRCNPDYAARGGCEPLACQKDSQCDCGVCVSGSCSARPMSCWWLPY